MELFLLPPRPGVREKWTYGRGRHVGETIDDVAEKDPDYLRWTWREPISQEAVEAIEQCAEAHDIELK